MLPKLAYVVNTLNLGGTEQLVVKMARAFSKEFEVFVVCLDEPGLWAPTLRKEGVPVYCLYRQPGIDLTVAMKLADFCRRHRVDIIHAHQTTPWFYAGLSRYIYRRPRLLFEEHGRFYPEVVNKKKEVFNRIFLQPVTHQIAAVSEDVKQRIATYEGLTASRIQVIYNGANEIAPIDDMEKSALRRELNIDPHDFLIGSVGRLDPIKNLPLLVNSLSQIRKDRPVKGLIVGDGPEFANIRAMIEKIGISNDIIMAGYRSDAAKLIQCLDFFVLCSFSEGTSMALLEAMAAGVAAVVTNVGGNPEVVVDKESGWVVPSDSQSHLTQAIMDAMDHPEKKKYIGENARRRFESHFTFKGMCNAYRQRYDELIFR